ncbi:Sodium- and chloride-dependent glycine transporter 2 [Armadillidium vulgare]|nr:Sodium- and chloride-dependent glycine transporter 2 [Armadillidium vulgare]
MLITLGLDSQFTMVETITTAIFDQYESLRRKKPIIVCLMCFVLFLCGLTMCLRGGIYMFELFNNYTAGLSVVLLAITEICVVQYVYGFKNIMRHIAEMDVSVPKFLYAYWAIYRLRQ